MSLTTMNAQAPRTPTIERAGLYRISHERYHTDQLAAQPSMSASDGNTILKESPRHCWHNHARLNPDAAEQYDLPSQDSTVRSNMEFGSALHSMVLEAGRPVVEVQHDSWQKKDAKEQRDTIHAEGGIPILTHRLVKARLIVNAVREQIAALPWLREVFEAPGQSEVTMAWKERIGRSSRNPSIWCRAMCDRMPDDPTLPLIDFKFTTQSTSPFEYERSIRETMPLRSNHYLRGSTAIRKAAPRDYWIIAVEQAAPFGLSVFKSDGLLQQEGAEYWSEAGARFWACLERGFEAKDWPFWPMPEPYTVGPSSWQIARWEARKLDEGIKPSTSGEISIKRAKAFLASTGTPMA